LVDREHCRAQSHAITISALILAVGLAACGVVSTLVDRFKYAKAIERDLQEATGIKPAVGFNWHNGRLVSVTVTFPRLYDAKPLGELAEAARAVVTKEFKQTPENIVLAFTLGAAAPGRTAQAEQAPIRTAHWLPGRANPRPMINPA